MSQASNSIDHPAARSLAPGADESAPEAAPSVAGLEFNKLVHDHMDFVWRALRRFGVPEAEVDDATQHVFLLANEKLSVIRAGSERSFLLAVATRIASHARRANQRREAARQRLSEHEREATPTPEHLVSRIEARDLLDRVLDEMPVEVRTVFVLFELEDLTVDEVARLLELPRGTVATRLRRARVLFQDAVKLLKAERQLETERLDAARPDAGQHGTRQHGTEPLQAHRNRGAK
jgi:RNA polymerase sigma-70 factor (ECF subfamily)